MRPFEDQMDRFRDGEGFVAALDQSGGSTPKALRNYGVPEHAYHSEEEMFDEVHKMRTRIMTDPNFSGDHIIGTILFEGTAARQIMGKPSAAYLWEEKQIVPFIKIDKGLDEKKDGVRLMKSIPSLDATLQQALDAGGFGTKMRSVIDEANEEGIKAIVDQQFELARRIWNAGLVPIVEPEVSIDSPSKAEAEHILRERMQEQIDGLDLEMRVILKLTLPSEDDFYACFVEHEKVMRVLALSGGYTRDEANDKLSRNPGVVASFSRALIEDLRADQSKEEFSSALGEAVKSIYQASLAPAKS